MTVRCHHEWEVRARWSLRQGRCSTCSRWTQHFLNTSRLGAHNSKSAENNRAESKSPSPLSLGAHLEKSLRSGFCERWGRFLHHQLPPTRDPRSPSQTEPWGSLTCFSSLDRAFWEAVLSTESVDLREVTPVQVLDDPPLFCCHFLHETIYSHHLTQARVTQAAGTLPLCGGGPTPQGMVMSQKQEEQTPRPP